MNVFYISETETGGSLKYVNDLSRHYGSLGVCFYRLRNRETAKDVLSLARPDDILIFQYLLNTDFTFEDIVAMVQRHRLRLVVPIHDNYFLNDDPATDYRYHPSLHIHEAPRIPEDKREVLEMADHIVFPSKFVYNVFRKHIALSSMTVVPHLDKHTPFHIAVPPFNGVFCIGVITPPTYYKGIDMLERLYASWKECRGIPVRFFVYSNYDAAKFPDNVVVRGWYDEDDVYLKLRRDGVQGLLFLNRLPETYSYALTKGFNAGLPLIYTRMGAIAERVREHIGGLDVSDDDLRRNGFFPVDDDGELDKNLGRMIDYIQSHAGPRDHGVWHPPSTIVPRFYDSLFLRK